MTDQEQMTALGERMEKGFGKLKGLLQSYDPYSAPLRSGNRKYWVGLGHRKTPETKHNGCVTLPIKWPDLEA